MKRLKWILCAWIALVALVACSNDDADGTHSKTEVCTVNVDVILPKDIYSQWSNSIEWMQSNLEKAQRSQDKQIKLNIRYHDEDTEDLDHLGFELTHPEDGDTDTCHAIIGPYHDENARHILNYAATKKKPVLLPTCVSGELQRINARTTNAWFLTESDITKCEVILSTLKSYNVENIALIYSDDNYGQTYRDWFGFLSTEYKLNIVNNGIIRYSKGMNIKQFVEDTQKLDSDTYVILALSTAEAYVDAINQIDPSLEQTEDASYIFPVCTQNMNISSKVNEYYPIIGFSSAPSPSSGFTNAYLSKFGKLPSEGEAQMYDALSIIALGEAKRLYADNPNEKSLTDWMRDVVSYKEGVNSSWTADGLATTLRNYSNHQNCNVSGTTGSLLFDQTTHTKILQSCYQMWTLFLKDMDGMGYYSTAGSNSTASTSSIWDWQKMIYDDFDPNIKVDRNLPACTDHWALLLSPSTTWANYRHQADVFAMYQLLKKHGYDDDHIIVIAEDNLATAKENAYPGKIFVEIGGENVRDNVKVDYHFSDLTRQDIADIMLGKQSAHLPEVFHTTNSSDILFFWSGHGGESDGPLWGDETADYSFGSKRIKEIVQTMHEEGKYRRMLFAIETCFSGIWGKALTGIPDVLTITAANAYESSKADVMDRNLGIFLSNAFARSFRDAINSNPAISLRDLYLQLAKTTTGSHVSLYNESEYGSVYSTYMSDYMK